MRLDEKLLLGAVGIMAAGFVVLWLGNLAPVDFLFDFSNLVQTASALVAGTICLRRSYRSRSFSFSLSVGLALLSWALGNTFWFSYARLFSEPLLYPSLGEFGFLGYYLLILGGLSYQIRNGALSSSPTVLRYLPFVLLAIPMVVARSPEATMLEIAYTTAFIISMAFTLYQMVSYRFGRDYWPLFGGIALSIFADVFFVLDASVFKSGFTFWRGPFWMVGFAVMAYGVIALRQGEDKKANG